MRFLIVIFVSLFSQVALAWPPPRPYPPPPPQEGWVCQAQGIDHWGRWYPVYGRNYYQQGAAQAAMYNCQYDGLGYCRVTNCYPAQAYLSEGP